jgi:hypothetical protein
VIPNRNDAGKDAYGKNGLPLNKGLNDTRYRGLKLSNSMVHKVKLINAINITSKGSFMF